MGPPKKFKKYDSKSSSDRSGMYQLGIMDYGSLCSCVEVASSAHVEGQFGGVEQMLHSLGVRSSHCAQDWSNIPHLPRLYLHQAICDRLPMGYVIFTVGCLLVVSNHQG